MDREQAEEEDAAQDSMRPDTWMPNTALAVELAEAMVAAEDVAETEFLRRERDER